MPTSKKYRSKGVREAAKKIFASALKAVAPYSAVKAAMKVIPGGTLIAGTSAPKLRVNLRKYKNVFVIGAGKAAPEMARAAEEVLGRRLTSGVVVTKYGHAPEGYEGPGQISPGIVGPGFAGGGPGVSVGGLLKRVGVIESAHPVPDKNSLRGASEVLKIAARATHGDLVVCLISGGASALVTAPVEGVTLSDLRGVTSLLLKSGADIRELNAVRKHLSVVKGGLLAARALPADVLSLIVSDVVGDDPSTIASGPTAPDPTTFADAAGVLKKYDLEKSVPQAVLKRLRGGAAHKETPKPGSAVFKNVRNLVIASNTAALRAAKTRAKSLGFNPVILTSSMEGPAREAARFLCAIVKEVKKSNNPVKRPACILAGGETTVRVTGAGSGGRCQELALAAALELKGTEGVTLLSASTDGADGDTDAAGAFASDLTVKRAEAKGLDPRYYLKNNDSHTFFGALGDLLVTGPTGTNVMDIVVAIVE